MKRCRYCGSEEIWKNGKRNKKQNYMCKECRRQFTSEHGRHTEQEEKLAILLYCMGLSMTAIGKIMHYHTSTIMRWIRKYAKATCRKPEPKGEIVVELDEMWHFIKSKKINVGYGKRTVEQQES